ncbi:N6-Methyl-AMP deaminase isoform X2 [Phyllobates terribilis]|uniref:N6-Methyl-AMP deaminase isoform X2 n=1 Tax=Phyllobates terribilis TaxID=111132 RepID=UPI003CCAE8B3
MSGGAERPFYTQLPKVELHAHLNGSISSSTMKKLMAQKPHLQVQNGMTMIDKGQKRSLEECFQIFRIIHQITDTAEDILLVTKDVIKEFAADGVKYLELRSTPRESSTGMTKRTYVETVLEGIKQCKAEEVDIDVRFLLAIDRRGGPTVAKETVKLAEEFFHSTSDLVLGLDLSGDPTVPSQEEETVLLLGLPPDRIGHGTFLCNSPNIVEVVKEHRIPMELCLTSNVKGQTVSSYDKHHFGFWYNLDHPSVLCTDDKGVFATDLSLEYEIAAKTFNLTPHQIWDLSNRAIDYIFAPENIKLNLKEKWTQMKPEVFRHVQ